MFWAAIFYWSALRHVWFIFDESNASSPNSWINGSFELVRFSDLHYNWFLDEWLFWTGWFWWIKSHNDQCSPIPERMHLLNRSSVFTIPKNDFFFWVMLFLSHSFLQAAALKPWTGCWVLCVRSGWESASRLCVTNSRRRTGAGQEVWPQKEAAARTTQRSSRYAPKTFERKATYTL